jgi:hypothetical protein
MESRRKVLSSRRQQREKIFENKCHSQQFVVMWRGDCRSYYDLILDYDTNSRTRNRKLKAAYSMENAFPKKTVNVIAIMEIFLRPRQQLFSSHSNCEIIQRILFFLCPTQMSCRVRKMNVWQMQKRFSIVKLVSRTKEFCLLRRAISKEFGLFSC